MKKHIKLKTLYMDYVITVLYSAMMILTYWGIKETVMDDELADWRRE